MFNTDGLLPPQIPHAIKLRDSILQNGVAWDGSITGAGKTYVACSIARDLKRPFVVICPKISIPMWERMVKEFGLNAKLIINFEKLARGNTKWLKYKRNKKGEDLPDFLLANLKFPTDWLIILDESHKCKGVTSLNAGIMFAIKRQGYSSHLMSATQATTPLDMRAFGYLMDLHNGEMKKFKEFCVEAGAKWVGKWGAQYFDSDDPESVEKLKKIHHYLFDLKKVGSRLVREDFGSIFPDNQIVAESYDMGVNSDKIQSVYDEMEAELDRLEEQAENYKEHILAIITKARRKVELLKVPTMVEMSADLYQEGKSVALFVNYTDTIQAIYERLSKEFNKDLIGKIYGGQPPKQRIQDIDDFQADKKRFVVANLAAGGLSISLHDLNGKHPRGSIINPSWSAISVLQSMGRCDRAYTKTPVYQRALFAARTIEENVCRRFQQKKDHIDILNDGDLIPSDRIFKIVRSLPTLDI